MTRIAPTENAALDISLEDGSASEWKVPLCRDVWKAKPPCGTGLTARLHAIVGDEMLFTLPCDAEQVETYRDIDYHGEIVSFKKNGRTYYLRTMSGAICCSGHPLAEQYLNSRSVDERGGQIKLDQRRIDGLDSRGVSKDGTHWRWVGPLVGEFAEYKGVDADAMKYFDAILDGFCFQPKL